jgi:hypothetical protein
MDWAQANVGTTYGNFNRTVKRSLPHDADYGPNGYAKFLNATYRSSITFHVRNTNGAAGSNGFQSVQT